MITENNPPTTRLELFQIIEEIEKTDQVVEAVRKFGDTYQSFKDYLRCVFDERIQFLLPEGKPPYTPAKDAMTSWHKRHLDLGYWVKGMKGEQVNVIRREKMFLDMLEGLHADDALIIVEMISKKPTSKKLTKEVVDEAFPGLCG